MNNYRVLFEILGAIGVALTALTVGYTISSGQWEANLRLLEKQNTELQTKLDSANGVISNLKVQLSTALFEAPLGQVASGETAGGGAPDPQEENSNKNIRVTIQEDSTADLFDGSLFITVVATDYEGNPLRHTVIGRISAPGEKDAELKRVEPGYNFRYAGYEIRVLSAGTLSATFLVKKLP